MGVCGPANVTLRSSRLGGTVQTWSIPAYCSSTRSPSLSWATGWATGDDLVFIRPRIARALNIRDGDMIDILFDSTGETFRRKVRIPLALNIEDDDTIDILFDSTGETFRRKVSINGYLSSCDVIIHDMFSLNMIKKWKPLRCGEFLTFKSGRLLILPRQNMWAGMKYFFQYQGSATLFFHGASRNNPNGPAGYGFRILKGIDESGPELVEGYGYCGMDRSNNEMEYEGLIEGLIWAMRLDLARLMIRGDSELVIRQMTGKYRVKNLQMKVLHGNAQKLLQRRTNLRVKFIEIPRCDNGFADNLANKAIIARKNAITVNWPNVNALMAGR